jgi:hypothetical protein
MDLLPKVILDHVVREEDSDIIKKVKIESASTGEIERQNLEYQRGGSHQDTHRGRRDAAVS